MAQPWDVIVVGTGAGGLTAGLSLARDGRSVLMLEAGKQIGGMLNPFARRRYHFDVGVHYLGEAGPGQPMRRLLDSLGLEQVRFREINPDCIDEYHFDGYQGRLVKGRERWFDLLASEYPKQVDGLRRLERMMEAATTLSKMAIKSPGLGDLATMARSSGDLVRLTRLTWGELLDRLVDDRRLYNVLSGPSGDIGLPPSRGSALYMMLLFAHYLGGGYYPVGGSGAMRDAYVDGLRKCGAEMLRNRTVERIVCRSDGRFDVITADGERHEARSVVSNADARLTLGMIEGARPGLIWRRRMASFRPSLGTLGVFLATDLDLPSLGVTDANIWHVGRDIEEAYAPVLRGEVADDPFFFLSAPTLKDPDGQRAPEGVHTIELFTFVPQDMFAPWLDAPYKKRGEDYDALKDELADRVIRGAERYVPGLSGRLLWKEAATPATIWHFVKGRDGGIYGPEHTPDQVGIRRLMPSIGIPGLYLAGASVVGCGVMACMSSGMMAAGQCRRHLDETTPASARILPIGRGARARRTRDDA